MSKSVKSFLLSPSAEQIFVLYYVKAIENKKKKKELMLATFPARRNVRIELQHTWVGRLTSFFIQREFQRASAATSLNWMIWYDYYINDNV